MSAQTVQRHDARRPIHVIHAGSQDYLESWSLQRALVRARRQGLVPDLLLLLEHPPTYTIGRSGSRENLLIDEETLASVGAVCYDVDRGGDITFHGPGQIVGYVILDLGNEERSIRRYLDRLAGTVIQTVAHYGVQAGTDPRHPGVWVGDEKIAALGVAVSRAVTYHGFALNIEPDLRYFSYMIPCGIRDRGVTSLAREYGASVDAAEVTQRLIESFASIFERDVRDDLSIAEIQHTALITTE